MTIIKIVFFIAILSSVGEHKGIQCSNSTIDILITFSSQNIDIFHIRCYHVLFIYIFKELYEWRDIETRQDSKEDIQNQLESSANYFLRLLRLNDCVDSKIISTINRNTWNFYNDYKHWVCTYFDDSKIQCLKEALRSRIVTTAKNWIHDGINTNTWSYVDLEDKNNITYVMRDYNYCDKTLESISHHSIYIEEIIENKMLYSKSFDNILELCEPLTKFGYIMHIMKRGEKCTLMSRKNITEKKLYVIKVMKSILNFIFRCIISLLNEINLTISPANFKTFNQFLEDDTEASNLFTIIKQLYLNAIDTTKEIYGIHGINDIGKIVPIDKKRKRNNEYVFTEYIDGPPSEFTVFITDFQTKFQSLFPGCFKATNKTKEFVYVRNFRCDTNRVLPSIIGIYNICWPNNWVPKKELDENSYFDTTINIDSLNLKDKQLLEYNVYLMILQQYAIHFNGNLPTENLKSFYERHKNFILKEHNEDQKKFKNPNLIDD